MAFVSQASRCQVDKKYGQQLIWKITHHASYNWNKQAIFWWKNEEHHRIPHQN